ncbi:TonB-dependent receptor domain-containing protein [Alteromonas lipolytica]|uniref:TonB-dependent receptor n=1 Tax=Alteromonas lipolytica TaxID=1856405 RepID=A0A1E8FJ20_9ALTE|nr:TonB-dependent receptor [Alteromonas lipolytica]OFI35608.1 hypothetical protein BFC17_12695 [Alteromonas lipolytica]GGF77554.1 TonB-dependent receptor [Alteromonas lipolytica]
MKKIYKYSALAFAIAQATTAFAQEADSAADQATAESEVELINVTGSRIATNGAAAPTPVTAISQEDLANLAPSNIPDALNKLPQFTASTNQAFGGTFNADSPPLGNYFNLRGLGAERVLTMLNGQRISPTSQSNAVDANIIPQLLIKRVEVVTGGASAVYGSDAVSGVVNFITDDNFEGIKFDVSGGISAEGDNETYKAAIAGGFAINDKTNVILSAELFDNQGVPSLFDRDFAYGPGRQVVRAGSGNAADPYRTEEFTSGFIGLSRNRSLGPFGPGFTQDGLLAFPIPQSDLSSFGFPEDGGTSIAGTLETARFFGKVSFDLSDTLRGHVTAINSNSDTSFNSVPNNTTRDNYNRAMRVFGDNPYLNPATRTQLGLGDNDHIALAGLFNDIGVVTNETTNEYNSFQIGFEGEIGYDWTWEVTYNWGEAKQEIAFNEFKMREVWAAMDAVVDPSTGEVVCGITLRNPGAMDDCSPLNAIGYGNFSQEARDFVRADSIKTTKNTMQYLNFAFIGDVMDLPGGALTVALGGEFRKQELDVYSNADPTYYVNADGSNDYRAFVEDHIGIRGIDDSSLQAVSDYENGAITEGELRAALNTGTVPGFQALRYSSVNPGGAVGKQDVTEFFVEANAPLTEDFTVNLAARSTDYKTSGRVTTWKVGTSWHPTDSVRVRATASRDIAAPTLTQLFASPDPFFGQFIDTHLDGTPDEQNITPLYVRSGNQQLDPEEADTLSIGIVLQPEAVPGLTMSVDWYSIDISGAFGNLDAVSMNDECEASNGTASVCSYIIRPLPFSDRSLANAATEIRLNPFNLALLETSGVDIEVGYNFEALGGKIDLRGFLSHVIEYKTQQTVDDAPIERQGYTLPGTAATPGLPEWKGLLTQSYSNGTISATLSERFTGSYKLGLPGDVWDSNDPNIPGGEIDNEVYVDLNVAYAFGDDKQYSAFVNVQNLTDVEPPVTPALAPNLTVATDKQTFDVIGTMFTFGVRGSF